MTRRKPNRRFWSRLNNCTGLGRVPVNAIVSRELSSVHVAAYGEGFRQGYDYAQKKLVHPAAFTVIEQGRGQEFTASVTAHVSNGIVVIDKIQLTPPEKK